MQPYSSYPTDEKSFPNGVISYLLAVAKHQINHKIYVYSRIAYRRSIKSDSHQRAPICSLGSPMDQWKKWTKPVPRTVFCSRTCFFLVIVKKNTLFEVALCEYEYQTFDLLLDLIYQWTNWFMVRQGIPNTGWNIKISETGNQTAIRPTNRPMKPPCSWK